MHGLADSCFLWRNRECTDPINYVGEDDGVIYNRNSIPNPLKVDIEGPLFYLNWFHAI